MSQAILRNEDFKTTSVVQNVRGIIYRGEGFPLGRVLAANLGSLYIDNLSGQLWISTAVSNTSMTAWKPYFGQVTSNIRIDGDVQEGDLIGIFGAGTWTLSGNIPFGTVSLGGTGAQSAAMIAGGSTATNTAATVLFNGSIWTASGNLPVAKSSLAVGGSQNAGVSAGGFTNANTNASELFNGSTWTATGTLNTAKSRLGGSGTQLAAIVGGGFTNTLTNQSELFNGSIWTTANTLNSIRQLPGFFGSVNAAVIAGGLTSAAAQTDMTELFNGTAWSRSGGLITARREVAGAGSQNGGLAAGGFTTASTRVTEIFNGSVWANSGVLSEAKNAAAGAGSQNAGLIAGGTSLTELHNQTIYRKLKYPWIQNTLNIGMAYNLSATSLTGSIMTGDLGSVNIPPATTFGISRYNNNQNNTSLASLTPTVSSITLVIAGQARLNLSVTLTNAFWTGMCLLDSSGNSYPVIGGTGGAPVVRWENASNSASPGGLTVTPIIGHRFTSLSTSSIVLSANSLVMTLTGNMNLTASSFARWVKVGDVLQIPYSSTSGSTGSSINYGSYLIYSISGFQVSVTKTNTASASETANVGNIQILQHVAVNNVCLEVGDTKLGQNGKMHNPYYAFNDDASNGRM